MHNYLTINAKFLRIYKRNNTFKNDVLLNTVLLFHKRNQPYYDDDNGTILEPISVSMPQFNIKPENIVLFRSTQWDIIDHQMILLEPYTLITCNRLQSTSSRSPPSVLNSGNVFTPIRIGTNKIQSHKIKTPFIPQMQFRDGLKMR